MSAWEREYGELPSPTFVPVGRKAGGHVCFLPSICARALTISCTQRVRVSKSGNTGTSPFCHQIPIKPVSILHKTNRLEKT